MKRSSSRAQDKMSAVKYAAVAMVERADGRLLVVWNKRYGGWTFPGGLVEEGETALGGLLRELREETGLYELTRVPYSIYTAPAPATPGHADRASVVNVWRVQVVGEPVEGEVGCAVTWLTREEFLKWCPFRDFYAKMFEYLETQRNGDQSCPDIR
jgi:8-oxo-dGTP pyrophosphatase MutT (NUDIX family)